MADIGGAELEVSLKIAAKHLNDARGGSTFSDTGISGFLSGHDRRGVHAKAET